jgi:hypothetical protein
MQRAAVGQQLNTLLTSQLHEETLPTFIYSYNHDTHQLHSTNLVTGKQSSRRVPSYQFQLGCYWSVMPGGSLLVTGGNLLITGRGSPTVVKIDIRREFAVAHQPPMLTPRAYHAAAYHTPHLYVLGGSNDRCLSECERYVCEDNRWEPLLLLPNACFNLSGVVVVSSLYALGGLMDHP